MERDGHRVSGVYLRAAEVVADLSTAPGRAAAIAAVNERCGGRLDGLVVCAGVGPHVSDAALIVSLNYFGAQRVLDGLRPALARGESPAAVAISSNSSTIPNTDSPMVAACLADDEAEARRLAAATPVGGPIYGGSKLALTRWVRRQAPQAAWAGAGIRLNAVAPGPIQTPLLQAGLDHAFYGPAIRNFPVPAGGFGQPDDVAAAVAFLLGPSARFCCGSVLFVDGGTDALLRSDQY
jgi:NAD(P)-dependent dehydrogenase (short-subunit alcohol dehydrogenase family)